MLNTNSKFSKTKNETKKRHPKVPKIKNIYKEASNQGSKLAQKKPLGSELAPKKPPKSPKNPGQYKGGLKIIFF